MKQVFGQQDAATSDNDYSTIAFVFQLLLSKVQTATLVKIISCTNDGGVAPVGRVTVQPLVNQMSGNRQATEHGQIFNAVYSRLHGGLNAVILDPEPGDIGIMVFCSRDISAVVKAAGVANPGSRRVFDWADGVYVGGVPLGVTPTQYVQFLQGGAGINVVSPTAITLTAPTVTVEASAGFNVTSPASEFSGTIHTPGTITGDTDVVANGTSGHTHHHSGVTTGGSNTGPPT